MSNGAMFLAELEKYLGQSEDPNHPNRSGGPVVDACQRHCGYSPGVPWCGCLQKYCADNVGYKSYMDICNGYTGFTYDEAKKRGWLRTGGADVPPGSLFILNGRHIGAVRSSGKDYFLTLEGNSADSVRSQTRAWSDGWEAIVPPDLGTSAHDNVTVYGFEDLETKPVRYGGWVTQSIRDKNMLGFKSKHPEWWVRPIRIATKSPFAFEAGPPNTFNKTWNYGPWQSNAVRDQKLDGWKRLNHSNVRTYSKTSKITGASASGVGKVD